MLHRTLDALVHGGPRWSNHHWDRHWSLLSCLVVITVLVDFGSPPGSPLTVTAHQPPRSPTAQQLALATFANQLIKARLGSPARTNAYYDLHTPLGRSRSHYHHQQQPQLHLHQLNSAKQSKAELLAAERDPWAYYYYKHHGSVPSCDELRYLWKHNRLGSQLPVDLVEQQPNGERMETEEEREKLRHLSQTVPKERQVYITGIVPETKQVQARHEESTEPPQPSHQSVSPFGIIHASPHDLGRTTVSSSDSPVNPSGPGVFGEFFDNLPMQDHDRYLSGYNLRNGKQGLKTPTETNKISGNSGNNINNNNNNNKENGNDARRRLPSAGSSSGSRLREFNSPRFPGVWHNKPVKPSVQIL